MALCGTFARSGLARVDATPKPAGAGIFLHCSQTADLSGYSDAGIVINQPSGTIRTGIVPVSELESLAEDRKVKRIVASRKLRPLLDAAAAKVKLPAFRTSNGLSGNGVVIGIIDTGIDATHPDFRSRIHRIWDQDARGPGVAEGSYGLELAGARLTGSEAKMGTART